MSSVGNNLTCMQAFVLATAMCAVTSEALRVQQKNVRTDLGPDGEVTFSPPLEELDCQSLHVFGSMMEAEFKKIKAEVSSNLSGERVQEKIETLGTLFKINAKVGKEFFDKKKCAQQTPTREFRVKSKGHSVRNNSY